MTSRTEPAFLILGAAFFFGSAIFLSRPVEARLPPRPLLAADAPAAIPPELLRALHFGFSAVAADALYLQAIQVHGEQKFPDRAHRRAIARLIDTATDVDPHFCYAYRLGALAVTQNTNHGYEGAEMAIPLLEKGVKGCTTQWQVPFFLAYIESWMLNDQARAAKAMAEAARRPGAPKYIALLSARLAAQAGSIEDGIAFTEEFLRQADNPQTKAELEDRLGLLQMELGARQIENAVRRYKAEHGDWPGSVETLVETGLLAAIPSDEHDGRFVINRGTGEVTSTAAPRLHLPGEVVKEINVSKESKESKEIRGAEGKSKP